MKTLTLYMEKRDLESVIRFLSNLRSNGVMRPDGWLTIQVNLFQVNLWREAQKLEVNYMREEEL